MVAVPQRTPVTTDDIGGLTVDDLAALALPASWELVAGRLIDVPLSGNRANRIAARVYRRLAEQGEDTGLGVAYAEGAGFVLFPDRRTVRGPDAAFVVAEKAVPLDEAGFVPVPPDLAVEVLSPHDRMGEVLAKVGMYLEAGVRLVWLVHPERRTVTVFTAAAPPVTLAPDAVLDGGDVLPDLRLLVADLFA